MTIRVEVMPDLTIEIMRPHSRIERNVFHRNLDLEMAMILIRYWLRRDLEAANKNRFVSQATKEARREFKQMEKRSPHYVEKKH